MSRAPKNNWQPSASFATLQQRAVILARIRDFFAAQGVLEVETPLLCHTSVTDPHIASITAFMQANDAAYYLQTSPEYAMKRLLASGSGSIYQLGKSFRRAEVGQHHNPEFTMLEWYRIGFDHHDLMNDVEALLQHVVNTPKATRYSYADVFDSILQINPHVATIDELAQCADKHHINTASTIHDRNTWLDLLMSHCIEPQLGKQAPCFIYDFPASQAALARIIPSDPPVAARFEVYINGIELANGFHELQDANEQRKRFEANVIEREALGLEPVPIDELFLAALEHGLPDCAGVALGVDRLVMIATHASAIKDVMSFDASRA